MRFVWGKSRGASEVASRIMIRCTPLIKLKCYTGGLASTEAALIKVGAYMLRVQRSVDFEDSNYNKWLALILKIAFKILTKVTQICGSPSISHFCPKTTKRNPLSRFLKASIWQTTSFEKALQPFLGVFVVFGA